MPTYIDQLVPLELPLEPIKGETETAADFQGRHATWWRSCDVILKKADIELRSGIPAEFANAMTPTLAAWNALDARLSTLAEAIAQAAAPQPTQSSDERVGVDTLLEAMRITKGA